MVVAQGHMFHLVIPTGLEMVILYFAFPSNSSINFLTYKFTYMKLLTLLAAAFGA